MDAEVTKPKAPRAQQVRLEKLDADTIRKVLRTCGIAVPYLLREAVALIQAKYGKANP